MSETHRIPLFPLGIVALPEMLVPLHIFEDRYKLMISECLKNDAPFGIVLFDGKQLFTVGCTVRVTEVIKRYEDGRMDISTRGEQRFLVQKVIDENSYMEAYVSIFEDAADAPGGDLQSLIDKAMALLDELYDQDLLTHAIGGETRTDPNRLSFAIAALEDFTVKERQRFLEMTSTKERIEKEVQALIKIVARTRLSAEITAIIGGNGSPPRRLIELVSSTNDKEPDR